jgi:hypothetical protein
MDGVPRIHWRDLVGGSEELDELDALKREFRCPLSVPRRRRVT